MSTHHATVTRFPGKGTLVALHRTCAPEDHPHLLELLLHRVAEGEAVGVLAVEAGRPIGYAFGERTGNGEVAVVGLGVAMDRRQRGIGVRLVTELLDVVDARRCRLVVAGGDRDGRRRCRRHGLQPVGQRRDRLEFAGEWRPSPLSDESSRVRRDARRRARIDVQLVRLEVEVVDDPRARPSRSPRIAPPRPTGSRGGQDGTQRGAVGS